MNRDWQRDLELAHKARYGYKLNQLNPVLDALFYWLQQYAAEKERADKAEAESEKWRIEAFKKYPTPEAYDAACLALHKHRERADRAEEELAKSRAERKQFNQVYQLLLNKYKAAESELAELKASTGKE